MKRIFFLLLSTSISLNCLPIIKLPNAKILGERLSLAGFNFFVTKTNLLKELADQEKTTKEIINIVENAFNSKDYLEYLENDTINAGFDNLYEEEMYEAILKDEPTKILKHLLKELKEIDKKIEEKCIEKKS